MKQKSLGFRTELLNINYNVNIIFAHDSCNRAPDNNHCVYNIGEQRVLSTTHWSEWMSVGGGDWWDVAPLEGDLKRRLTQSYWMSISVTDVRARTTSPQQYPDSSWLQAPAPFCLRTSLFSGVCLARVQAGEWTPCEWHSFSERPKHLCRLLVPP